MIIDTLKSAGFYFNIHPGIEAAVAFIADALRSDLNDGEYDIDGRSVYAIIGQYKGKGKGTSKLEAHKKYIDVQFCIKGYDEIGWKLQNECVEKITEYDQDDDIIFFADKPVSFLNISGDTFCILFPQDAHAPLSAEGDCRKIIVKVAV